MRILRIGGRNLASLAEPFSVDFEAPPLAASGLFAISGPTGAGKSTLLDALCLALYGATPRLKRGGAPVPDVGTDAVGAQDPRSLLRRGAGEGYAEVDFVGNDGLRYRAQWSVRRAYKRATGALQGATMTLHRLPEMVAIGGKRTETADEIEKRIGLSFDQFTRAVLLAQNEFAAFLKTDENDRGELLETLTGSTIYSAISKRAHERYRREQEALRQLGARLADQAPCSAEERAALDAGSARADSVLAELDARQHSLEQLQRWRVAGDTLAAAVASAEAALADAAVAVDQAAPRRQQLALLAALKDARPLQAEVRRLRQQQAALAQEISSAQAASEVAQLRAQQSTQAVEQAGVAAARAEQALAAAAAPLNEARALDAAIAALAPAFAQVQAARAQADDDAVAAAAAVQTLADALATAHAGHAEAESWLQAHGGLAGLAAQWPRWDSLLAQAARVQHRLTAQHNAVSAARLRLAGTRDAACAAAATAGHAAGALAEAQAAREQAAGALTRFDSSALRDQRIALARQREQLAAAAILRRRLAEQQARRADLGAELQAVHAQAEAARAAAVDADASAPALAGALRQSEHALRAAELACAEKVEDLRGQLSESAPCPVCGALEHPYAEADASPALHAVLAALREQLQRCQEAANANRERHADARALRSAAASRSDSLSSELAAIDQEIGQLRAQWQAAPPAAALEQAALAAAAASPASEARAAAATEEYLLAACTAQLQTLDAQLRAVDASEEQARQALLARDLAQAAFDRAARAHAIAADSAAAAGQAERSAAAELAALADRTSAADADLQALLGELDAAFVEQQAAPADGTTAVRGNGEERDLFSAAPAPRPAFAGTGAGTGSGWRAAWQHDPIGFQGSCAGQAAAFNERALARPARQAQLAELAARHAAAIAAAAQAAALRERAGAEHARHAQAIGERQRQRGALFGGESVDAVEGQLQAALAAARTALAAQQQATQAAVLEAARCADQLLQRQVRLGEGADQQRAAEQALAAWLADFPIRQPALGAAFASAIEAGTVDALLAMPAAARDMEQQERQRQALQAIDAAAAAAATVLAERRAQLAHHGAHPPPGHSPVSPDAPDALDALDALNALNALDALDADLAHTAAARKDAAEAAAALRARIAEDTVRRRDAETALAAIERQQLAERRWGRLAELIGSADGKKFRNYAQQFTLDVLLGYANAHLLHLAKRYRLERVFGASGPSLGLMVRDQDMGGEARSVNSLSGGESFLVSLALALGLASLSSNRVKVESLFIDEGFGSLDSDTLRVAMDALDGLQAMGRKVGVISHVQEMTERIATRIVVAPAGAGSSSVTVE